MRGSPQTASDEKIVDGIIPAHAGLTILLPPFTSLAWDHPRACGAHAVVLILTVVGMGSSPRMRGSRHAHRSASHRRGIIPAHAGLTIFVYIQVSHRWDHPRACGAHVFSSPADIGGWGSSPRMRGSLHDEIQTGFVCGIIPAHAGLTPIRTNDQHFHRDHPRACGAHVRMSCERTSGTGSSPRMRGSLDLTGWKRLKLGIIPAHAGLTNGQYPYIPPHRDHPRACGAHT